jgi:riboflavin kinase / FMN adenylyltransferase
VQVLSPEEAAATATEEGTAVTIGAYDGVHIGHRRILQILRQEADARGAATAVVTFDRHPATVIRPESAPALLTDPEQKLELLAGCGVDMTVVVPFDPRRAAEPAEDFVDEVLTGALRARVVVVGEDFHFGHGRQGNVALLGALGAERGFGVVGVALAAAAGAAAPGDAASGDAATGSDGAVPAVDEDQVVSSTRIRALVAAGDVARAAALLTRPHEVRGPVVHGDGRGGALGIPTANVAVAEGIAVPAVGIYAGWCRRPDGSRHPAAISVGHRPTFYEEPAAAPLVEAHLVDFDGDLYGERVGVAFVQRLRAELRFDRVEDLVEQMQADVARTRSVLGV